MRGPIHLRKNSNPSRLWGRWAATFEEVCRAFGPLTLHRLPGWMAVTGAALAEAVEQTGVIRILGLDCPLDVFRRPNEFEEAEFDGVCQRARFRTDGTLLPHPTDLIQTKTDTGRDKSDERLRHRGTGHGGRVC